MRLEIVPIRILRQLGYEDSDETIVATHCSPQGNALLPQGQSATHIGRVIKCAGTVTDFRQRRNSGRPMVAPTFSSEVPTKSALTGSEANTV